MNEETIGQRVLEILADETGETATAGSSLDSLGMDSLDFLDLITRVEAAFDVQIPETAAVEFDDVSDLIAWVENACA